MQVLAKLVVTYKEAVTKEHALLNRIEAVTTPMERKELVNKSGKLKYSATVLPIRTVGVQGDKRSYSYAVAISCAQERTITNTILKLKRNLVAILHFTDINILNYSRMGALFNYG